MKEHRCAAGRALAWLSLIFAVFLLAPSRQAAAQDEQAYTLRGTVVDALTEEPLPGANVQIEGTTFGTATGVDGEFSFEAPLEPGEHALVVSFVGYRRAERPLALGAEETVDVGTIPVEEDVLRSEEIVVTGTGVPMERRQLGVSISSVDAADLQNTGASAIDQALQGKIAGALVQQNSGNPAGGISVSLRGAATVLGSGQPLYVVDGVIVDNASPGLIDLGGGAQNRLVDLNPEDIERIEVVKGAAAAALYGSRANNGVVQIFTKTGRQGAPRITFKNTLRTDAVRKTLDVNMAQNAEGEFLGNDGEPLPDEADSSPGRRYDFQDFIFQRAYGTEQYLSASGGNAATQYYVSGTHFANEGIVEGNLFRRLNGRVNLTQRLAGWANLSAKANFTRSTSQDVPNGGLQASYGALTGFIFGPNTYDPRANEEGVFPDRGILANPLEVINDYDFGQETRRFLGNAQLTLTPVDGLNVNYLFGLDTYEQTGTAFIPKGATANSVGTGFARRSERNSLQLNNDLNVSYEADLSPQISSTTLVGGTLQYEETSTFSGQSYNLAPGSRIVDGGTDQRAFGEFRSEQVVLGIFAQETLGLGDRLFLTAAGRFDASSSFGAGERWQFYPKISGSYLLSEEGFWQDAALDRYVSNVKLRAALGYSGGLTAVGPFARFTNYAPGAYGGNPSLIPSSQIGSADVKPERQREYELGFDLGFLDDRFAVEFTYYNQRISDLLLTRSLDPSSGFLSRLENVGTLDNRGIELLVRALPINRDNFSWTSTVTYATNENEVNGLEEDFLILGGFGFVAATNGQPLGIYYADAFQRTNDDGDVFLEDSDGEIVFDENGLPVEFEGEGGSPRKIIGDPNPDWTGSWINEFTFGGGLSVRAQLDAVIGQDVFNFTRRLAALPAFCTLEECERELEGELPAGYNARTFGIFEPWVEDGSFVKLRELSVAYLFTPSGLPLRSVRVTATGRNLFSIDDYSGYDPEINVAGQSNTVRGFDFVEVPIPRTFSLSVALGF